MIAMGRGFYDCSVRWMLGSVASARRHVLPACWDPKLASSLLFRFWLVDVSVGRSDVFTLHAAKESALAST